MIDDGRYTESEREAIGDLWDNLAYLYYGADNNAGWERAIVNIYHIVMSAEKRRVVEGNARLPSSYLKPRFEWDRVDIEDFLDDSQEGRAGDQGE